MKQYKHVFDALVNGNSIEVECRGERGKYTAGSILGFIQAEVAPERFHVVPKNININGHEVPEPVREPLEEGRRYYLADISHADLEEPDDWMWCGDVQDLKWLSRGLIHLTPEAAEAHAKALLSFTQVKVQSND